MRPRTSPPVLSRLLVGLYPRAWRARYGDELAALLEEAPPSPGVVADVVRGALAARATPLSLPGGPDMTGHSRVQALASLLAVALVLPSLAFLSAATVRLMQPREYQPARAAWVIFDFFGALPRELAAVVLLAAPALALVLGLAVAWRRLADDPESRTDIAALGAAARRMSRHPALVAAILAALASAAVLIFAADHLIAG